jgi:hypothetical protein
LERTEKNSLRNHIYVRLTRQSGMFFHVNRNHLEWLGDSSQPYVEVIPIFFRYFVTIRLNIYYETQRNGTNLLQVVITKGWMALSL